MRLTLLQRTWNLLGKRDPLFAILCYKDKRGKKWNLKAFFDTGETEADAVLQKLDALKIKLPRLHALDFGCGIGRVTQALAKRFDHATGVDIAPSMITLARQYNREPKRCDFVLNARNDLSCFPDNSFDFIYSNITLQHMEPRHSNAYLAEFARTLTPGGTLFFQLPVAPRRYTPAQPQTFRGTLKRLIPHPLYQLYYTCLHYFKPIIEMHSIPRNEVIALLTRAGLTVRHAHENDNAGKNWVSYEYCAVKPRAK